MLDAEKMAEVNRQAAKFQPPLRKASSADYIADADENEPVDNHRNAPRPDPACLYGLVGDVARAGGDTTEANPFAIAANFLAYMACAVGRGPYMPVGNTWHHPRLFTLHVGRSGRGRKGDAVSLVTRIDQALRAINRNAAPQVHRGGLSTREGLAFMIHDAYSEGKNEVPAVLDKRLLVIESEFANILQQGKRDGNTLSSALRDCWDGVSIKPATKTNRLSATDPHVCIIAAITPGELINVMAARELTNGFANRFLMIWAERTRVIPFPVATSAEVVISLAQRVSEVLEHCKASRWGSCDHMRIELLPDARKLYEAAYLRELNDTSAGERITALLERRAPMVLRLAMLFALCDRKRDIGVAHVNAALAWVRYSIESVKFVFASGDEEADTAQTQDTAQKVFAFLQNREKATRRELTTDCFQGHVPKRRIDAALDELLASNPPRIRVEAVPRPKGTSGNATKVYRLAGANSAKSAKCEQGREGTTESARCGVSELCEVLTGDESTVRTVRTVFALSNQPQGYASIDSSHSSHASPTDADNTEIDI